MKSSTASCSASGSSGYSRSASRWSDERLVTRRRQLRRGSKQLGERGCRFEQVLEVVEEHEGLDASAKRGGELLLDAERLRDARLERVWSRGDAASGTQRTPSRNSVCTSSAAACSASRVLPVPPVPVTVTRRASSGAEALVSSASSRSRPIERLGWRRAGSSRSQRSSAAGTPAASPSPQQLIEPLGLEQVLESMFAEVAQASCRRRPSATSRWSPARAAPGLRARRSSRVPRGGRRGRRRGRRRHRLARVEADPDADRLARPVLLGERALARRCGRDGRRRTRVGEDGSCRPASRPRPRRGSEGVAEQRRCFVSAST